MKKSFSDLGYYLGKSLNKIIRPIGLRVTNDLVKKKNFNEVIRDLSSDDPIETIIDAGANIGQAATGFVEFFPDSNIYCIEPTPSTFNKLLEFADRYPRVTAYCFALADKDGTADFFSHEDSTTNSLLKNAEFVDSQDYSEDFLSENVQQVPTRSLVSFFNEHQLERIDILKLDTEGNELSILENARELLKPSVIRYILVEAHFVDTRLSQCHFDQLAALLREQGYKLFNIYPEYADDQIGIHWGDALFIPGA